jgi:hypothetical protein
VRWNRFPDGGRPTIIHERLWHAPSSRSPARRQMFQEVAADYGRVTLETQARLSSDIPSVAWQTNGQSGDDFEIHASLSF